MISLNLIIRIGQSSLGVDTFLLFLLEVFYTNLTDFYFIDEQCFKKLSMASLYLYLFRELK